MKKIMLCVLSMGLGACSTGIPLEKYAPQKQARNDFTFCYGYSCKLRQQTGFTDKDWKQVEKIFRSKEAKNAAAEREKIAQSIALMERIIGAKTGTSHDFPEARGIKEDPAQMDCIDETMNTSRYLEFLEEGGLLQFHKRWRPIHRGYFINGWPHNTATIIENETGQRYAVDSFYRANGQEPYILRAEDWLAGWKPAGSKQ